jgi:putative spermidine/putrescine transport system substrate-binding protein
MNNDRKRDDVLLTRRGALKRLGAAAMAGGLVGTVARPTLLRAADAKGPINFLTWGGAFGKGIRVAFSDPFTTKTGITIKDITPFNLGKFRTAMQHGNPEGYDLAWFDDEVEPTLLGAEGLVEELNYDWMPNATGAIAGARQKYGAAPYVTIYAMSYNINACQGKTPTGWKDFWNVDAVPGPRSLGTWVCGVLEAALMADGVAPLQLYPLDEARAFKMLDRIKPHIRVFHNTQANAAVQQMLLQGEVAMILTWATDTLAAKLAGKPVGVVYDEGFYFSPLVGIAKGSKYLKECHQYLDSFFDPAAEQAFISAWPTTPANPAVLPLLTDQQKSTVATSHLDKMVHFSVDYYAQNRDRLQQKYDSWRVM